MSKDDPGKASFIPVTPTYFLDSNESKEKIPETMMESIYWQTLGWVHTPPFKTEGLSQGHLSVPKSRDAFTHSHLYFKKAYDPKLQIEDKIPYGKLPKTVMTDLERRRFARQNLRKILEDMGLVVDIIRPPILRYREGFSICKTDIPEGIPTEPILSLELFDDEWFYETRSAEEWLSLGITDDERKPVPGTALIPVDPTVDSRHVVLQWQKVAVLDYDEEKKLYLVRNEAYCTENNAFNSMKTDLWVPRIYLKFEAEDSLKFSERLRAAVTARHMAEESLRMCYYVDNMPIEQNSPSWSQEELDAIISVARRSRYLQPKLQWIKDASESIFTELQTQYRRSVNYMTYMHVTGQNPNLMADFRNQNLNGILSPYSIQSTTKFGYSFSDKFENFSYASLWSQLEVVRTLQMVQSEILSLGDMSLYNISSNDILSLEKFESLQREEMKKVTNYIHKPWLSSIANAVNSNISSCKSGNYDLNQTVQHTFQLTKIGKLLRLIGFKMQDVMRYLVTDSLDKYVKLINEACSNLEDVKEGYTWEDSFTSDRWLPLRNPVFEVALEIKGVQLEFSVDLQKYRDIILDLFDEGLRVTKDLPRLEKLVMKKLISNPDDKLESVGIWEKRISQWKKRIVLGMNKAIIVSSAYTRCYDETLKAFQEDQINYVKRLMRSKVSCEELRDIIEMHHREKNRLAEAIPDFVDIGPFRLMTATVRFSAIKRHEQLADAVLTHFYDKLRDNMERLNDQFLVLLDRIDQGTGNIEDLLDRKVWCRTVPKKVERLSADVNVLRATSRLLSEFNRNMEDDDFTTFWRIQELPQLTMKRLDARVQNFDEERQSHKRNLAVDLEQLTSALQQLEEDVSRLHDCTDVRASHSTAVEIRRIRKELTMAKDKAELYNKREKLFGQPATEYPQTTELSEVLVPYELLWLNASEFLKYRDRVVSEELVMEKNELREKILEFREHVEKSLEFFEDDTSSHIRDAIHFVLKEMEKFLESKWLL